MQVASNNSNRACPKGAAGGELPPRERVLEVACQLFAEAGFHGTHIREICERAGTNVAGVCYHFQSKEGLYQAVILEAGRRLSEHDEGLALAGKLSPERRLLRLTELLLEKLSANRAWRAKLLARELVDRACEVHTYVAFGLERHFVLLQAIVRELLGAGATSEAIRLHALSLIGDCVFYTLAVENPRHPLTQDSVRWPTRPGLARFLTRSVLGALRLERVEPEVLKP